MTHRVLVVDDDRSMTEMLSAGLACGDLRVETCTSGDEGYELLGRQEFDVVVTDLNMQGVNGLELCERIVANRPDVPVVVITAFGSLETAIAAIRAGAYDFIPKPVELEVLEIAVRRAIQHRTLKHEVNRLRNELASEARQDRLRGSSPAMRRVDEMLDRVCDSPSTVLVTGESGTGKERVARALHERSRRRAGPFVAIDCAAIPEQLLESELFGHESGAFTDARRPRPGLFVQASEGTLFLDEIGELPLSLQPKLLRAIQERRVRPLGARDEVAYDARIVAATNRDLEASVEEGRFREDLFYRVNVIHVELPPLRARGSDVLHLAQHFLDELAPGRGMKLAPQVAEKLLSYHWPGNVRELENCIERAVAVTRFEQITAEDLPEKIRSYRAVPVVVESHDPNELLPMDEVERRYVRRVLEAVGGNKTLAARVLGFDRKTLYRKLEKIAGSARTED